MSCRTFRTLAHQVLFAIGALLICLPAAMPAQTATTGEQAAWLSAYTDWLRHVTPDQLEKGKDPLRALRDMYREHLKAAGVMAPEADQRWTFINQHAAADPDIGRLRTNLRFAAGWYEGEPPSSTLRDFIRGLKPGRAVDCGMGSGRNTVLLASMGWQVTGMDMSDTAVEQAWALATRSGVHIDAVRSTYRDFGWGKDKWDLIVNIDAQDGFGTPNWPASSTFFSAPLAEALKSGGVLYVEAHAGLNGSNPLDGIARCFPTLRVVKEDVVSDPVWEEHSKLSPASERWKWPGTPKIAVFIAEKPLAGR